MAPLLSLRSLLLATLIATGLSACAKDDGAKDSGDSQVSDTDTDTDADTDTDTDSDTGLRYERDLESMIQDECGKSCHAKGINKSKPILATGKGYKKIVGIASKQSDLLLVDPGDHQASYLWHKVNGSHKSDGGGKGVQMPKGVACCLKQSEIDLIADWIDQGARE